MNKQLSNGVSIGSDSKFYDKDLYLKKIKISIINVTF